MIISDLDHLKTIVEAPSVVGGFSTGIYGNFFKLLAADQDFQGEVAITEFNDSTGEAVAASGRTEKGELFAFAAATQVVH